MSIAISSDDSNASDHEEFEVIKKNHDNECVDLTQGGLDYYDYEPAPYSPMYEDLDDMLPPVQIGGSHVSDLDGCRGSSLTSSATSSSTSTATSSGYGSVSSGSRRRSVDSTEDKSKKKKTASDKLQKKQKAAEERAAKQVAAEFNRVYKPGECMKYMTVELHPSLLDRWYCADVAREAAAAGARAAGSASACDPALVRWSRRGPRALQADHGQMALSPRSQSCARALCVLEAGEAASLVAARALAGRLAAARALAGCPVTLVLFGVRDFFKSSNRRTQNSNRDLITEIELEMALTDLLVTAGCDSAVVNTPNELALLIVQFTKAIAEEPFKKLKRDVDEQADFYMRGDNKKCVSMDKDGNGASRLWQQMIAVLPGSSLETSRAVCGQYKSPLALYEALQLPNGVNDLADLGVSRAGAPGSKNRRLGPEFARKLRILFTAVDGDVLVE